MENIRIRAALSGSGAAALVLAAASPAWAFGGTAEKLQQQGNFVVTSEAGLGWTQRINDPTGTSFSLQPALEYMVVPSLSLGGHVLFAYTGGGGGHSTTFGVAPEIGYEVALSGTWSVWPKFHLGVTTTSFSNDNGPSHGTTNLNMRVDCAFLVHPAEHFFFGAGPFLSGDVTGNGRQTLLGVFFTIGGYFNS